MESRGQCADTVVRKSHLTNRMRWALALMVIVAMIAGQSSVASAQGSIPPGNVLLETVSVPANGTTVVSQSVLANGITYYLKASGTVTVDCCAGQGDAEWFQFPGGSVASSCGTTPDVDAGIGVDDPVEDPSKSPNWGAFNAAHVYVVSFVGKGATIALDYHDCFYHDNAGSLTVEIYGPAKVLTVTKLGTGSGTVTSAPAGVNCGADCTGEYAVGTVVALTPTADAVSVFTGWSGACTGTGACNVTMDANKVVRATFKPKVDLVAGMTESADPAQVGANLTYNVTVRNLGPGNATAVTVTDTLPAALTFVSATPSQGTCSTSGTPTKVTCSLGTLNNGASATIALVVVPNAAGSVTNAATVSSSAVSDTVSTNNSGRAITNVIP